MKLPTIRRNNITEYSNIKIITIDGPASSGKGTVAKLLAHKLGFHYLDSGSIYRALALFTLNKHLDINNGIDNIVSLIDSMQLEFKNNEIYLNNELVSEQLRDETVGMLASKIASFALVRNKLLNYQRSFAKNPGLVTDGRDMGSIVFPEAYLKIFLTASAEKRAERRYKQLQFLHKSGIIGSILEDIKARDKQDSERGVAPLSYDDSFFVLDNSELSIEQTVETIYGLLTT